MTKSIVRVGLVASFIGFGLACGGGTTDGDISTTPAPAGDQAAAPAGDGAAAPAATGSADFKNWSDKDVEQRLKAAGWTVEECYSSREDGEEYNDCDAVKGNLAAAVELTKYTNEEDARWTVEDEPAAVRDGKVALEVTVYDGDSAAKVLDQVAPKGTKINAIESSKVEAALKGLGFKIEESSRSREDGMIYEEVYGTKGAGYAVVDWSYKEGGKGGQEIRITESGSAVVTQGYEDVVSIVILDADKAKALLNDIRK